MRCQGKKIKGSGYTKPLISNSGLNTDMQALLAARDAQDARYFPVDPNPPAPLAVAGLGSASTIITSSQGLKSPVASCTRRS